MKIIKSLVVVIILLCSVVNSQADRAAIPSGNIAWPTVRDTYLNPMTLELYNFLGATAGVLPATPTFSGLIVSGDGDSWLELENNTSFTDSLTGKYGIRFYNGVLQQIINGTASSITSGGGMSITEGTATADPSTMSEGDVYVETDTGTTTIKTELGSIAIAGTYTADPVYYTLTVTDPGNGDVIASTDTFINCGDGATDCTHNYESGSTPELTAIPAAGRAFTEWTGDATDTSATTNPDTITIDAAKDISATFAPAGFSDAFAGARAALATHDANWTAASSGVANLEIDGSGKARLTGTYRSGAAYYATSTSDVSQIVVPANGVGDAYFSPSAAVRMSGSSDGYRMALVESDGTNWTDIVVYKNGSVLCYLAGTFPINTPHTIRIEAVGSGPVTLHGYIDGIEYTSSCTDSTDVIVSGSPGFKLTGSSSSAYTTNTIESWQDHE